MLMAMMVWGAAFASTPPQIIPQDRMAVYRAALPHVTAPAVEEVLHGSETFWYDAESMVPSYQDTVGDGSYTPIGARANSAGKPIIVPEGKKFFSGDGHTWSFPFGHTAGLDDADNAHVINFLRLPKADGVRLPVVYKTVDDSRWSGLGLHRWLWQFPVGTVIGELIFVKDGAGRLYPTEVRTRSKGPGGWAANIFRPFPTAADLAAAVKRARPEWQGASHLSRFVAHLENPATLESKSVGSDGFDDIERLDGWLDVIPDVGDEALVKELLTSTRFSSAYGTAWKKHGEKVTYAASTFASFSVVPRRYFAGLIEVTDESCARCHQHTSKMLQDFEPATVLYGDLWGQDRIFSFHPWDPSRYRIFNNENRQVRPEFRAVGFVERFEVGRHGAPYYVGM